MTDSTIKRIQDWYKSHCNGDWEHSYGVSICTLDNPGWKLRINLTNTGLENIDYEQKKDNGDDDWCFIRIKDNFFEGYSDPDKLELMIKIFLDELLPKFKTNN